MAANVHTAVSPLSADFEVGDDSDLPGFSQPVTADDIDAVLNSARGSVDDRRATLASMLNDLQARQGMDESDEYDYLIERLDDALAALDSAGDGFGAPEGYAHDAELRPEQPDEILERREEEEGS